MVPNITKVTINASKHLLFDVNIACNLQQVKANCCSFYTALAAVQAFWDKPNILVSVGRQKM